MTARSLLLAAVLAAIAAVASVAQPVLQPVATVVTPQPVAWGAWDDRTLAVTELDARMVNWSSDAPRDVRALFDLPAPPSLVDVWGDSILIQVPGEGGRLLARGVNDPTIWIEKPANWRLANTEIDGVGYRIYIDPQVFLLVYSAPGPGGILGLFDIAQTIGQADVWAWGGDRVLLGNDDGVHVVDISNPLVPVLTGVIAPPVADWRARRLAVHDRLAYVHWGERIAIHDLTNPGTPSQVNQFVNTDSEFIVRDRWLVSWGDQGAPTYSLTIVDVSDPAQLSTRGTITTPASVAQAQVAIDGDRIEVLHPLGLSMYEIPAGMAPPVDRGLGWPVLEGRYLATAGQTAWLQGTDRRYVVNLTSETVVNVQSRGASTTTTTMNVVDDVLYYGRGTPFGVQVESLADPRDPQPLTLLDPTPDLDGIDVAGDLLAAADGSGLVLYDVSDPAAPLRRGELVLEGATERALIVDDIVVVSSRREFAPDLAHVVDITDRDAPLLVESFVLEPENYPTAGHTVQLMVRRGDQVQVMLSGTSWWSPPTTTTATIDLTAPASPTLVYVVDDQDFWCFDPWADGAATAFTPTLDLPVTIGDFHVSFRADTVSVYAYQGAADQLDRLATWIAPDPVETIAAAGNKLLVFGNHRIDVLTLTDFAIVDVPDLHASVAVLAVPNPFNPQTTIVFDMPRPGTALVEIYDVRGGQVRRLEARVPAGPVRLTWRGDDQEGRGVPSGTYLLRVRTPDGILSGRCQLIR